MNKFANFRFTTLSLPLLAVVSLLAGCATPAGHEGMTPDSYDIAKKHPQTVSVSVGGGNETSAAGKSQISNSEFQLALEAAITKSQVFSGVIQGNGGNYLLNVTMFSVEQPSFGLSFTVKLEAGWTLKRADNGTVVWQESIKSSHTATTSDAFAGVARLRIATEGAAKDNIKQGLAKISRLNL
jgi:hypothetical protein